MGEELQVYREGESGIEHLSRKAQVSFSVIIAVITIVQWEIIKLLIDIIFHLFNQIAFSYDTVILTRQYAVHGTFYFYLDWCFLGQSFRFIRKISKKKNQKNCMGCWRIQKLETPVVS